MLYDDRFIRPGVTFPPVQEITRLQRYKDNRKLFDGDTYNVFKKKYENVRTRIDRIKNDYHDMIAYPIDINYHKLTSVSLADLVQGETPTISVDGADDEEITKLLNEIGFFEKLTQWTVDISRYGDAVARVYIPNNNENKAQVAVLQPGHMFKIVDKFDKDNIKMIVLATVVDTGRTEKEEPVMELFVEKHLRGSYTEEVYKLKAIEKMPLHFKESGRLITDFQLYEIGNLLNRRENIKTGQKDFAVIPMHQLKTSDSCYGVDDYDSIDPILSEIWARLGQIAIILDKHARPDMHAPMGAFQQVAGGGRWELKTGGGNTFIVGDGESVPGYITWDGQLDACFREIDILFDQLYKVSEMGPIFEAAGRSGSNISFDTMKTTFVKPLSKARRVTKDITLPLKEMIVSIASLNNIKISVSDISIDWFDGLPDDENQEIMKAASKINAGLSTPKRENVDRFGLTKVLAEDIAEEVREYEADRQATMFGGFGSPTNESDVFNLNNLFGEEE